MAPTCVFVVVPYMAFEVGLVNFFYWINNITHKSLHYLIFIFHGKFFRYEAKKKKHKKVEEDEILEFPGQEKIKFGDIVQAPPKLSFNPKVSTSNS